MRVRSFFAESSAVDHSGRLRSGRCLGADREGAAGLRRQGSGAAALVRNACHATAPRGSLPHSQTQSRLVW